MENCNYNKKKDSSDNNSYYYKRNVHNKMLRLIIDHAHLSKLRPLTVYWVGKGNLSKVYSYDIIIPKQYKADEVSMSILENLKANESNFNEDKNEENVLELLQKIRKFKAKEISPKSSDTFSKLSEISDMTKIDDQMKQILSHPLVYSDLETLVMDLRFK